MGLKSPDVDAYVNGLDNQKKGTLKRLRALIHQTVPFAEESMEDRIPTYHYFGRLCAIVAGRNHFQFYLYNKRVMQAHAEDLKRIQISNGGIRFKSGQDLPDQTIKRLLESAAKEAERRC
jgi:uncharacterized protein YdhG (YjbR/CyaY superfamily)